MFRSLQGRVFAARLYDMFAESSSTSEIFRKPVVSRSDFTFISMLFEMPKLMLPDFVPLGKP